MSTTLPIGKSTVSEKMLLLPHVASKLESEQAKLRQAALKLAKPSESREKGADIVLCQCGHLEEEGGEMVRSCHRKKLCFPAHKTPDWLFLLRHMAAFPLLRLHRP